MRWNTYKNKYTLQLFLFRKKEKSDKDKSISNKKKLN